MESTVNNYDFPSQFATASPSDDLKHRVGRARGRAKRRLLAIEWHRQTGRYSLVYSPLGQSVEGYQATTLGRIEHALETIAIKHGRPKTHGRIRCRPMSVVLDLYLNAEGRYE
jgi:hypothetical protein